MAERPVFTPSKEESRFVTEIRFEIPWASGFAPVQKRKNILALHEVARSAGLSPLLEVSTKSDEIVGQHLSAFHLRVNNADLEMPLECAFQGSKLFERGGPYNDLYGAEPRQAKRDVRLRESGPLVGFEFDGFGFPLQPLTVFYDWLYLKAIYPHREWLKNRLDGQETYEGFTDIEFNPSKSINCQARSCALFVSLVRRKLLDTALSSPSRFIDLMTDVRDDHSGALALHRIRA